MAYKIKAILNLSSNLKAGGKFVGTGIRFKSSIIISRADVNGSVTVPNVLLTSDIDALFKNLPITQFGMLNNTPISVSASGSSITFNGINPLFMEGQYFEVPQKTLNINSAFMGAGTAFIYIQLKLGIPAFLASDREVPETGTSMFIGTVTKNASNVVTANTLSKVSRFDQFRASLTKIGGAFPVSSGNPTQPGSISW